MKFSLFTLFNPSVHKNPFGVSKPGKGCAIGVEFFEGAEPHWCGLFVRDGMSPEEVARGLEALASAVRNKEWSAVGNQWRSGQEIMAMTHDGTRWCAPEKNTSKADAQFVQATGFEQEKKYATS